MSSVRNIMITAFITFLCMKNDGHAQDTTHVAEYIGVTARPYKDSVILRWAPKNFELWRTGNLNGYTIERYLMVKDGEMVNSLEKVVLNPVPIKPFPEEQWNGIVQRDRFSAIAAQALFGDRFEIDLSNADVFTIVNKVRENEQRYSFALFSADMSVAAARASGLWFTDKTVKKGEKYLYRLLINEAPDTLRGSVFVGPGDPYQLTQPANLHADFQDQIVSLRWDRDATSKYTAYIVERSTDGNSFHPTSDTPLITVSSTADETTRYEYATDSIADIAATYYYRVKGVTPFGETGVASDTVSDKSTAIIRTVPYIHAGENLNNASIYLQWDFPIENNTAIKGFIIARSSSPRGDYQSLAPLRSPVSRSFEDKQPELVNYYKVSAVDLQGKQHHSPVYLAQLIDSIPPSPPMGLKATVDDFGNIALSWNNNQELDMYGYRVYKSNTNAEEMSQITVAPQPDTLLSDRANLSTLNEAVYYRVMAIDRNQNHSKLSEILKVDLPDKVKPQPPVFLPITTTADGITLRWTKSSSTDVVQYDIYRRTSLTKSVWQRIKSIKAANDTIFDYTDEHGKHDEVNFYTVVAIDEAGLESETAAPLNAGKFLRPLAEPIMWKDPIVDRIRNEVTLNWDYNAKSVKAYKLYKSINNGPDILYKTLKGDTRLLKDGVIPGSLYRYRILVVFEDDHNSSMSKGITVQY